jgi:hypothetical protein
VLDGAERRHHASLGATERAQADRGQPALQVAQIVLAKREVVGEVSARAAVMRVKPGEALRKPIFLRERIGPELDDARAQALELGLVSHVNRAGFAASTLPDREAS